MGDEIKYLKNASIFVRKTSIWLMINSDMVFLKKLIYINYSKGVTVTYIYNAKLIIEDTAPKPLNLEKETLTSKLTSMSRP